MPAVDPEDDSICRWVVHHYRYDPGRHQRRDVLVAAFDNEQERNQAMARQHQQILEGRQSGRADPREHVSGTFWEPGYRARAATGHMMRRAFEHGVNPQRLLEFGELPASMSLLMFDDPA